MVDQNQQDDGFFLEDEGLHASDPYGTSATQTRPDFKEVWKKNPSLKILAIAFGAILFIGIYFAFGSSKDDIPKEEDFAVVKNVTVDPPPPGTKELTPAYEEATRIATEQRTQMAEATGTSVLPTPIIRPAERIEAPVQIEEKDPLSEWRRAAEERRTERRKAEDDKKAKEAEAANAAAAPTADTSVPQIPQANALPDVQAAPPPPLPTSPAPEQVQAYMQLVQQQMSTIMETQVPKESVVIKLNLDQLMNQNNPSTQQTAQGNYAPNDGSGGGVTLAGTAGATIKAKPIISAGTIAYAQMLTEANSDVPGPILAEIASGPLSGGRAIGTFSTSQDDQLIIQFTRIVKDDVEYSVQTFAVDPATTLTALATDVDRHYFTRVFLPAASTFVQGFADAATQKDTNVVVSNGTVVTSSNNELDTEEQILKGLKDAGQKASDIIDEDIKREPTIRVQQGTRMGILFIQAVFDPETQALINQQNAAQQGQQPGQMPGLGQVFNNTPAGMLYNAAANSNLNWGSAQPQQNTGNQQQQSQQQYAPMMVLQPMAIQQAPNQQQNTTQNK